MYIVRTISHLHEIEVLLFHLTIGCLKANVINDSRAPPPRLTLFLSLLFLRISILLLGSHPVYILCLAKSSQVCALRGYDLRFTWIPSIIRIIFFFIYLFIYWWEPWHGFVDGMRVNIYDSSWVFKENIFPLSSLPFQILTMKIYNNYLWGIN